MILWLLSLTLGIRFRENLEFYETENSLIRFIIKVEPLKDEDAYFGKLAFSTLAVPSDIYSAKFILKNNCKKAMWSFTTTFDFLKQIIV